MGKVLIIEDDPLVARMYQKVLKFEGMEVVLAENGREGLARVEEEKPNLILLDIMMPKMNGIEVLERLKANPGTKDIPVVMLTNLSGTHDAETALKKGAIAYMVKSQHKPKEIAEEARKVISRDGEEGQPQEQASGDSSN